MHICRERKENNEAKAATRPKHTRSLCFFSFLFHHHPSQHHHPPPPTKQAAPVEIKVKSKPVKQEKAKKGAADEAGEAIKGKGKH